MITAKNGSIYDRTLVNPDYKDWAPRVGLAYSVDPEDGDRAADTASATCTSTAWAAPTSSASTDRRS